MRIDSVEEYFEEKGAVEVIIEIGSGSTTFQQIEDAVLITSSTVSTRLKEALEHDIVEVNYTPTDHGTQKQYELSDIGNRMFEWIVEIELDRTVRELRRLQHQRDTEVERLINRVSIDEKVYFHYLGKQSDERLDHPTEGGVEVDSDEFPSADERRRRKLMHDQMERDNQDESDDEDETEERD